MVSKLKPSLNTFWMAGLLLLGLAVVTRYGESWDELKFYKYADAALEAYSTWPGTGAIPVTGNTYDNYGPAYVMFVSLGAQFLGAALPWIPSDLRHLLYFLTFLAGIWAFHDLCRRWLSRNAALGAALLFATQPLFWGHAFISPKDIPFLTFFLLSLVFGFRMVDAIELPAAEVPAPRDKHRLRLLTVFWLAFLLLSFGGTPLIHSLLENAIRAAAAGQTNLISWIASDIHTAAPEIYIQKYFTLFIQVRALVFWLSTAFLAWTYSRRLPSTFRLLGYILPAAIILGLTTCIRVLGPLAGLIVALYAWHRKGKGAVTLLGVYALIAVAAMYATWPYLWPDPLGRFFESLVVMAQYPWRGQVLFDGVMYESTDIPRAYLPVLLGIQLTEPVWFLFAAGLAVTVAGAVRRRIESLQLLTLTLVWFVLPLIGFMALRSPLYDNFRQVFFILPPVFILAGAVIDRIRRPGWQMALIVLLLLPGLYDGIRLHPYEYIYYNRYIGGPAGAFRRFEMDYWGTSFREAAAFINGSAPGNAAVWVEGPVHLFQLYARPDLKIYSSYEAQRADHYDCILATTRNDLDLRSYPDARVVHRVARVGVSLAVIKQPADGSCVTGRGQ
jgi:hypothetical protein